MDLNDKNPLGYSLVTYLWVIGLACAGGAVRYLNSSAAGVSILILIRDIATAMFAGLLTFWVCEWTHVTGPFAAVLIATSGLMGDRALQHIETLYKIKFRIIEKSCIHESDKEKK